MDLFCAAAFSAALSIDALAIGISCAARGVRIPAAARLVVCFVSAVITAAAVLSGGALSAVVPGSAARAFGAALLFFLGIYIIIGAFKKDSEKDGPSVCTRSSSRQCGKAEKALRAVAGILKNPEKCDADDSKALDMREALYLGAALSADSFAAGFGAGIGGAGLAVPVFCGIFQLVLLYFGELAGRRFIRKAKPDERILTASSGVLLIIIAAIRLF